MIVAAMVARQKERESRREREGERERERERERENEREGIAGLLVDWSVERRELQRQSRSARAVESDTQSCGSSVLSAASTAWGGIDPPPHTHTHSSSFSFSLPLLLLEEGKEMKKVAAQ